jgi:hypothetical protein
VKRLNAKLDHDVPCAAAKGLPWSRIGSPECEVTIKAGTPHYHWETMVEDTRFCRSCIREQNWTQRGLSWPLLVKVELTYHDGSKRVLKDDAAHDWESKVSAMAVMEAVHGGEVTPFMWEEIPPPEKT